MLPPVGFAMSRNSISSLLIRLGFLTAPKGDRLNNDEEEFENYLEAKTLSLRLLPGKLWVTTETTVPISKLKTIELNKDPERPLYLVEVNETDGTATISMTMEC